MKLNSKKIFILILILMLLSSITVFGYKKNNNIDKKDLLKTKQQILSLYSEIDKTSLAKLNEYKNTIKNKNNILINNKKENILITVTLNKPITIDEFEKLIDRYKIYIHRFALRAIDENGNRVTISGTIDKNGKISRNNIKIMVSETKSELKGVIDFYGEISYKYLKELQTDERIFLVDTSADNTFIENKYKKHIPSLYWYLEEYNK